MANVVAWRTIARRVRRALSPFRRFSIHGLQRALAVRGIDALYVHQAQSAELALQGENLAVVSPTAGGKTLCYNLPIF